MHGGTALIPPCTSVDVNQRGKKWERPESKDRGDFFTSKDGTWYLLCQLESLCEMTLYSNNGVCYLLSQRA